MKSVQISLVTAFLISIFSAKAQLSIGARGGVSLAKTMGNGFIQNYTGRLDYIVSGNGGVFLEMPVVGNLSFRPEVGYKQTGAGYVLGTSVNFAGADMPIGGTVRERLTYVQATPLLKYEFGEKENTIRPYIILGPTFNYMVDAKLVSRANVIIFRTQPYRVNLPSSAFNKFQVGAAVGAGLNFNVGRSKIFVEGRYERDFSRVYNVPVVRLPVHNQIFSLMAGFSIPLRKG